ncbi:MAG: GNAT family N-acetyltransferase, partial [Pseudomonadota bacterium]
MSDDGPQFVLSDFQKNPEFFDPTIQMIERAFGYSADYKYAVDFFPLFDARYRSRNHILIDQVREKVVGHIGVKIHQLGNLQGSLSMPVAFLGGIAIDLDHQKQGLLKEMLPLVLQKYQNDVGLFLLWSNLSEVYAKFGFQEIGEVAQTGETPLPSEIEGFEKSKLDNLNAADYQQVKKLYLEFVVGQFITVLRQDRDWQMLRFVSSTDLYLHRDSRGSVDLYFMANKGQDLPGIIHEIAGTKTALDLWLPKLSQYPCWLPGQWTRDNSLPVKNTVYLA